MIQFDRWRLTIRGTQNIYNGQSLGTHSPSDYTKDEEMYYKRLAAAIIYSTAVEYAEYIAKRIENEMPPKEIIIRQYDRCSGTHVGPGAMCLFFMGKDRHYND